MEKNKDKSAEDMVKELMSVTVARGEAEESED